MISAKNYVSNPTQSDFPDDRILAPAHWVGAGGLVFVLRTRIAAQPAVMVLANAIPVHAAVPADDASTRIRLFPAALFLSVSRLGGVCRMCQAAEVFVVYGECFDLLHASCVGGGE